jgi:hypothetical protein
MPGISDGFRMMVCVVFLACYSLPQYTLFILLSLYLVHAGQDLQDAKKGCRELTKPECSYKQPPICKQHQVFNSSLYPRRQ